MSTAELLDEIRQYAIRNYPDLCQRDARSGAMIVNLTAAQERLKARVVAELVSRRADGTEDAE